MDWNCAEVAKNLLFTQNSLNISELFRSKFFSVLTRPNREEFVEIFLSHGFQLHKFLTPSQLSKLFRIIHEDDFFRPVCWEAALGQSSTTKQDRYFIENDLNWLIDFCTGLNSFVNISMQRNLFISNLILTCSLCAADLHNNSKGFYTTDQLSAERKALVLLAIWAVM